MLNKILKLLDPPLCSLNLLSRIWRDWFADKIDRFHCGTSLSYNNAIANHTNSHANEIAAWIAESLSVRITWWSCLRRYMQMAVDGHTYRNHNGAVWSRHLVNERTSPPPAPLLYHTVYAHMGQWSWEFVIAMVYIFLLHLQISTLSVHKTLWAMILIMRLIQYS